ncbi:MAG: hypothetical protein F6K00_05915 [Leptolyngbya sp. SIOISBB]|nr:hypothetical protein [Leptolyngbya sp. SIOISBB]
MNLTQCIAPQVDNRGGMADVNLNLTPLEVYTDELSGAKANVDGSFVSHQWSRGACQVNEYLERPPL